MTDQTDLRQQLAAFFGGELDEAAAARLQTRIQREPDVARQADQMADMLQELGQVDRIEPPEGYSQRLGARLQSQTGVRFPQKAPNARQLTASGAAAATGWADSTSDGAVSSQPVSSQPVSSRPGPAERFPRLGRVLAVAAGIAVLAVATVTLFSSTGQMDTAGEAADSVADVGVDAAEEQDASAENQSGDTAFSAAGDAPADAEDSEAMEGAQMEAEAAVTERDADQSAAATEMAEERSAAPQANEADEPVAAEADAVGAPATDEASATGSGAAPLPTPPSGLEGPVVLDLGRVDDAESLQTLVGRDPGAQGLLGTDAALTTQLADDYQQTLSAAEPYSDGTPANRCVADVLQSSAGTAVPAVVARVDPAAGPAIAVAVVSSTAGDVLDTVRVELITVGDCEPLRTVDVAPE